jgi:hypothetical protein
MSLDRATRRDALVVLGAVTASQVRAEEGFFTLLEWITLR